MRVVLGMSAFLTASLILAAVWGTVLRTVPPAQRPPLLMRTARGWVLDLIGPFVLFSALAGWLTALFLGFALIAASFGEVPATPAGLARWLLGTEGLLGTEAAGSAEAADTEWRDGAVAVVAWVNTSIVVLVFAAHLVWRTVAVIMLDAAALMDAVARAGRHRTPARCCASGRIVCRTRGGEFSRPLQEVATAGLLRSTTRRTHR